MNIVDRRPNPKGKSLSNRQRFLGRARAEVKSAVQEALRKRKVANVGQGEKVAIPTRGISEPIFHHSRRTGRTEHVVPGNKEYLRGDEIPRPNGGEGRGGSQGSPDGSGEDAFEFTLSKEEFLDMFFEDLELPDLVKKSLKETFAVDLQRAGYTVTGSPANLSVRRTMRNSMARRISLRRPKQWELEAIREAIENARARGADEEADRLVRELDRTRASQQDNSLYRPARCPLQPFRARTSPEYRSGDVLPDGCIGVDDRGDERPRQALLYAIACFSDPALSACRYRLHPPH